MVENGLDRLYGSALVALSSADPEAKEIRLARSKVHRDSVDIFEKLSSFVTGGAADRTVVTEALPDGTSIGVSRAPLEDGGSGFATTKLLFLSGNVAVLSATGKALLSYAGLSVIGIVGSLMLGSEVVRGQVPFFVALLLIVPLAFLAIGLYGLLWRDQVRFDRGEQELAVYKAIRANVASRRITFAEVRAVQLCWQRVEGTDSPDYTSYEVNLILAPPHEDRLHLISFAPLKAVRDLGEQLAEFLDRPLLEHLPQSDQLETPARAAPRA